MIAYLVGVVLSLTPLLPHALDKHGWGLRVHGLTPTGPYMVGEPINHTAFWVTLINFSEREQRHDPLAVAYDSCDLEVCVFAPDGERLEALRVDDTRGGRSPFTVQVKVPARGAATEAFALANFGYYRVFESGRHRVEATFALRTEGKRDGRVLTAPSLTFDVTPLKDEAILGAVTVPLEGRAAARPVGVRNRVVIQQVRVGDRVLLVYRRYYGPDRAADIEPALRPAAEIDGTFRLAELPGKCEVAVTGAFGDWKPLTVTYKTSPTAEPVKLVINSVDGKPWTAEEERQLQERLKREAAQPKKP